MLGHFHAMQLTCPLYVNTTISTVSAQLDILQPLFHLSLNPIFAHRVWLPPPPGGTSVYPERDRDPQLLNFKGN